MKLSKQQITTIKVDFISEPIRHQTITNSTILKLSKYKFLFICIMAINVITALASKQVSNDTLILKGFCDIDSGIVHLGTLDKTLYLSNLDGYDTELVNGEFLFKIPINHPSAYKLFIRSNGNIVYISDVFYVEKGLQKININTNQNWGLPDTDCPTMYELQNKFLPWISSYNINSIKYYNRIDSLRNKYNNELTLNIERELENEKKALSNEYDSLLLSYTKAHPESYVALWKLVEKYVLSGYNDIYYAIFEEFSAEIKNSYTAKVLFDKFETAKNHGIGKRFPILDLFDSKNQVKVNVVHSGNRFTLVNFWFSDCSPCKTQFSILSELYSKYSANGFNIVGISIDSLDKLKKWDKTIKTYGLVWEQYIDLDTKEAKKLSIYSYPSNYLINENGMIIAKNIALNELTFFLESNLK